MRYYMQASFPLRTITKSCEQVLQDDYLSMLYLASLAPSSHNSQPWTIHIVAENHWILGLAKTRLLPQIDPENREALLSVGAFLENLDIAAAGKGYKLEMTPLSQSPAADQVADIKLHKSESDGNRQEQNMRRRRTIRNGMISPELSPDDFAYLLGQEKEYFSYIPQLSSQGKYLTEETILANQRQTERDSAQQELAEWIRWSERDMAEHRNGLTPDSMEISGLAKWYVEHFYSRETVMSPKFRKETIEVVRKQAHSGSGWLLLCSDDSSPGALLNAGRRLERLWLRATERKIAIHPMSQILEEPPLREQLTTLFALKRPLQFLLKVGYVDSYLAPVSPRMTVEQIMI